MKLGGRKSDRKLFKAQRERKRMLAINKALIYLRNVLANSIFCGLVDFQQLPKIEILKMAQNYIAILNEKVHGREFTDELFIEMLSYNLKNSTVRMLKKMVV
jgi:hypothetical protein